MVETVFVTGGTGFVGSRFLQRAAAGRRILCLSRARPAKVPANVEFIQGDLSVPETYANALKGCAAVVHLAAVTGKSRPENYFQVNREGVRALIGECRRAEVPQFLFVSTIAAKFGNQSRYYYAQSKRQAEELVAASGMRYTIVRPTMVLGKGSAVYAGLSKLANLPVIPIFGNGRALVQPVSVDDLSAALSAILEDPAFTGRIVEIGGPEILSIEKLLLKIRSGKGASVIHLPSGLMAAAVGLLEKVLLPVLPFTAGQIASFVNDGTVERDPRVAEWQVGMQTLDQMLASSRA